jgi:hypothetical protein
MVIVLIQSKNVVSILHRDKTMALDFFFASHPEQTVYARPAGRAHVIGERHLNQ